MAEEQILLDAFAVTILGLREQLAHLTQRAEHAEQERDAILAQHHDHEQCITKMEADFSEAMEQALTRAEHAEARCVALTTERGEILRRYDRDGTTALLNGVERPTAPTGPLMAAPAIADVAKVGTTGTVLPPELPTAAVSEPAPAAPSVAQEPPATPEPAPAPPDITQPCGGPCAPQPAPPVPPPSRCTITAPCPIATTPSACGPNPCAPPTTGDGTPIPPGADPFQSPPREPR